MPRQIRIEYPGALYHLTSRGDRGEAIFRDDTDKGSFLNTLAAGCAKTHWQVHAYCLLENHFHAVIETPHPNLVAGMKWVLGAYTMAFNRRHQTGGHLFSGRYRSVMIDPEGSYLQEACHHVHSNPIRAGLTDWDGLARFAWCSYGNYLQLPAERPVWLKTGTLLGKLGLAEADPSLVAQFHSHLTSACAGDRSEQWKQLRRGWCFGGESFRQDLLGKMAGQLNEHHYGTVRRESAEQRAEALLAEELEKLGWSPEDLRKKAGKHPEKQRIARRLREETTMTLKWVASRLGMRSWTYLACLLSAQAVKPKIQPEGAPEGLWHQDGEKPAILWD